MQEIYTLLIFEKAYMTNKQVIFISSVLFMMGFCACSDNKPKIEVQDGEIHNDSTENTTENNELDLYKKRAIPTSADANFEDFLYAFLTDDEFAESRIADVITIEEADSNYTINKSDWNDMHLFKYQDLYTYIYTNERDKERIKSPDLNAVAIEWVKIDSLNSDRYEFHLTEGKWFLDHIVRQHHIDKFQNEFLTFYFQFIQDKEFQVQSLADPVKLIYEAESEMNQGANYELKEGEWGEFHSETPMPDKAVALMDYGQTISPGTSINFLVRGITEAAYANYHFRSTRGQWKLYSVELP